MIRIDAIHLGNDSPIGPLSIGDQRLRLSEFDLIVILGPNGSGKTSLTRSLSPRTIGDVQTLRFDDPGVQLDHREDIAKWLVARTSSELMGPFESMNQALSKASGIGRILEERVLLERVKGKLRDGLPPAPGSRSPELASALFDHARLESQAIKLLGEEPLDFSAYDAIGRKVAQLAGTTWTPPAAVDDSLMRQCEAEVRPTTRSLAGQLAFNQACQDLRTHGIAPGLAERLRSQRAAVKTAREEAARLLGESAADIPSADLPSRCEEAAKEVDRQAVGHESQAEKLNALGALLSRARKMLESDADRKTCLVCEQPIERERLLRDLAVASTLEQDVRQAQEEAKLARDLARELRNAASALKDADNKELRATEDAADVLEKVVIMLSDFPAALDRISGPSDPVAQACDNARAAVDRCLPKVKQAYGNPTPEGIEECLGELEQLLSALGRQERSLASQVRDLNRTLDEADRLYRKLEPIRLALTEAKRINAMDWKPDWERAETRSRAEAKINAWEAAIDEMVRLRRERERNVTQEVIGDPAVIGRFRQLLDRVPHPLLRNPNLAEERVMDGETSVFGPTVRESRLSEGYQVLANLAAFIAVAGYLRPGQQHKAGWILLDEPTNALDPENRGNVADFLGSLDRDAMPRQMFITTFEREFADRLIETARRPNRRKCLLIELPPWDGSRIRQPKITPVD